VSPSAATSRPTQWIGWTGRMGIAERRVNSQTAATFEVPTTSWADAATNAMMRTSLKYIGAEFVAKSTAFVSRPIHAADLDRA